MRLRDLGETLGREIRGDGDVLLRGVAPLESAGPGDLSFVRSLAWAKKLS
jgi:UDP-3-O-[3-hydroxymyristoyl] glucosamine N-acyltransferase